MPVAEENHTEQTTIWEALNTWGTGLAQWQQFIAAHAVRDGELSSEKIDEAYQIFLSELALGAPDAELAEIPESVSGRVDQGAADPMNLVALRNLNRINAIPSTSELTFGDGLTVIYGGNGTGKSGFARLLSTACFSRSQPSILPNVYDIDGAGELSAEIVIREGNHGDETVNFETSLEHASLRRITVFDSKVAHIHLTEENPLGFQPAGFDVFPEMSRVIEEIGTRLGADITRLDRENSFAKTFLDESEISKTISELSAETDLDALRARATFGPTEEARLVEVDRQLAELQKNSPEEALKLLAQAKEDINTLRVRLTGVIEPLSVESCKSYKSQLDNLREKSTKAVSAGTAAFEGSAIKRTGLPDWVEFIKAAKVLADEEKDGYPDVEDPCLLCQRPLDEPSASLIRRYWGFLDDGARSAAEAANAAIESTVTRLKSINTELLPEESRVRTHIENLAPELAEKLKSMSLAISERRDLIANILNIATGEFPTEDLAVYSEEFDALLAQIEKDEKNHQKGSAAEIILALKVEHILLRHRQLLAELIDDIVNFVNDKKWVANAQAKKRQALNTRFITDKERELFRDLIEGRYRDLLRNECDRLGCNLPIEFHARGRSGQTIIGLEIQGGHPPSDVLSEGEQRAVALADFLTEVNLNPMSAGIVLDDPVTSQDHQRKRLISQRLAEEANTRQVIVFTHDLVFLSILLEDAESIGVDVLTHWVERNAEDKPGYVKLNDSPANSNAYRTVHKATETLAEANKLAGQPRVDAVRRGMGELRRTLEEIIIRNVFKGVIKRWDEQIRVGSLKKIDWSNDAIDEICTLFEELSRYFEGHSHSDEFSGNPPDVADLEKYIDRVKTVSDLVRSER